jgi:hypothetical protein
LGREINFEAIGSPTQAKVYGEPGMFCNKHDILFENNLIIKFVYKSVFLLYCTLRDGLPK